MLASVAAHYHVWLPDTTTVTRLASMYDNVQEDIRKRNEAIEQANMRANRKT